MRAAILHDRRQLALAAAIAAIAALGLALRTLAARGGLWVDEAWSVEYVRRIASPLGVLTAINHDNNHHLNSWWLELVGPTAPPLAMRALSIFSGTATILVAAAYGARRSAAAAIVAATLFALSPILVTYGSEARGYAPMLLCLMLMTVAVDRWLDARGRAPPRLLLATFALVGLLSQLTMLFGLVAVGGWILAAQSARHSPAGALRATVDALLPTIGTALAVVAVVLGAAAASSTGFQVGSYRPFDWPALLSALDRMTATTLALPATGTGATYAVAALAAAFVGLALRLPKGRLAFILLATIGLPEGVALVQPANPGYPRYYLLCAIGLLLIATELSAFLRRSGRAGRTTLALGLAFFIVASLAQDVAIIRAARGDPLTAIAAMRARDPQGTTILVTKRLSAVLDVAAAQAKYPLVLRSTCPARFFFLDQADGQPAPNTITHCAARYRAIAHRLPSALSGTEWTLYERTAHR